MTPQPQRARVIIEPHRGLARLRLPELWRARELIGFLAWRDLKARYKQTAIGVAWVVLQPLLLMLLFAFVFGAVLHLSVGDVPRPLFYYSALVPWSYFSSALTTATQSIPGNRALLTKIYVPRLALPVASVLPWIVDMAISTALLVALAFYYGYQPRFRLALLPAFAALAVASALAFGLWFGTLNARYRDVRYAIGFVVQAWFFASPILYPTDAIPEQWRSIAALNPMSQVITGFRWATIGEGDLGMLGASVAIVLVALVTGALVFRQFEGRFVDVV